MALNFATSVTQIRTGWLSYFCLLFLGNTRWLEVVLRTIFLPPSLQMLLRAQSDFCRTPGGARDEHDGNFQQCQGNMPIIRGKAQPAHHVEDTNSLERTFWLMQDRNDVIRLNELLQRYSFAVEMGRSAAVCLLRCTQYLASFRYVLGSAGNGRSLSAEMRWVYNLASRGGWRLETAKVIILCPIPNKIRARYRRATAVMGNRLPSASNVKMIVTELSLKALNLFQAAYPKVSVSF